KVSSDYQYTRNADGEVLITFKDECSETIQFFHEMSDHETYRTVALKISDRERLVDVAGKLEQENFNGKLIYDLPRKKLYDYDHFKDLGILLVRIPWWDLILTRLSDIPEVEMIHDIEAQWHIPEPIPLINEEVGAEQEHSVPGIIDFQLPELKRIKGDLGASVKVAVLDTGIDHTHPSFSHLKSRIPRQTKDFTSDQQNGWHDGHGHGSHVASIICSLDVENGPGWGMAPGIDLYVGKVLSNQGIGSTLDIVEAMRWAAVEVKADIVSMSLGGGSCSGDCLLCSTIDLLTRKYGTIFTVSAGNDGQSSQGAAFSTMTCPANASLAIAVAAGGRNGQVAPFSSRGKSENIARPGPDFVAPGINIIAARAHGTSMGNPISDLSTNASGTSMAAPHVAGYIAVLLDYYRRELGREAPEDGPRKMIINALDHGCIESVLCQFSKNCGHVKEGKCGRECQGDGRLDHSAFKNALRYVKGGEETEKTKLKLFPGNILYLAALVLVFLLVVAAVSNHLAPTMNTRAFLKHPWSKIIDASSVIASKSTSPDMGGNTIQSSRVQNKFEDWSKLLSRSLPVVLLKTYPFNATFFKIADTYSLNVALLMTVSAVASGFDERYSQGGNAGIMGIGWPLPAQAMGFESRPELVENPAGCIEAAGKLLSEVMKSGPGEPGAKLNTYFQHLFSGEGQSGNRKNVYAMAAMEKMKELLANPYDSFEGGPLIVFDEKFRAESYCSYAEIKAAVPVKIVQPPNGKYGS
ncbi:MAG: hypothetical protein DRH04_07650, partial [Deltaproteobacteria bacterium]